MNFYHSSSEKRRRKFLFQFKIKKLKIKPFKQSHTLSYINQWHKWKP